MSGDGRRSRDAIKLIPIFSATLTESSISALSGSLNAPNPDYDFTGSWWARQVAGPGRFPLVYSQEEVGILIRSDDFVYPRIDTSTINK